MIDRHLESIILRQRGHNRPLAEEVLEKLSLESKERLFRIFQDLETELAREKKNAKTPWLNFR